MKYFTLTNVSRAAREALPWLVADALLVICLIIYLI